MTSPPVRIPGLGDRPAAAAVAALVLAAGLGDVHGAQRTGGVLAELPTSHGAAVESIKSGGERLSLPESSRWPHGLQLAELRLDAGTLGQAASKAVSQWPAAQKADPAWEWVRVLVFLAQLALLEQGYDPGRPDGMMGPNTMMALLRWHAQSGEPLWIGLVNTVAYLLHRTLEAKGLEPGPREQFLGPRSNSALARWDGIFRTGATNVAVLGADAELTRDWVRRGFVQSPSSVTKETVVAGNTPGNRTVSSVPATGEQWGAWTRWIGDHPTLGGDYDPKGYGMSWKWSSPEEAAEAALRQCRKEHPSEPLTEPCGRYYHLFSTSVEPGPPTVNEHGLLLLFHPSAGPHIKLPSRFNEPRIVSGYDVQCWIITRVPAGDGNIAYFGVHGFDTHTEAETLQAYKRLQSRGGKWLTEQVSEVACNDR